MSDPVDTQCPALGYCAPLWSLYRVGRQLVAKIEKGREQFLELVAAFVEGVKKLPDDAPDSAIVWATPTNHIVAHTIEAADGGPDNAAAQALLRKAADDMEHHDGMAVIE